MKPYLAEQAKQNMSLGGKGSKNLETLAEGVDKRLAKQAGIGHGTINRAEQKDHFPLIYYLPHRSKLAYSSF
jgi:hypothetical protein